MAGLKSDRRIKCKLDKQRSRRDRTKRTKRREDKTQALWERERIEERDEERWQRRGQNRREKETVGDQELSRVSRTGSIHGLFCSTEPGKSELGMTRKLSERRARQQLHCKSWPMLGKLSFSMSVRRKWNGRIEMCFWWIVSAFPSIQFVRFSFSYYFISQCSLNQCQSTYIQ